MSVLQYISKSRRAQHSLARLDSVDLRTADRMSQADLAKKTVEPAQEEYPPAVRLFQDALLALYKGAPRVKPQEEVAPSHRLNQAVMAQTLQDRAFQEMHIRTRYDETMSFLGAVNLWSNLTALLDEKQKAAAKEAAEKEQEAARLQAKAEAALAAAQAAAGADNEDLSRKLGQQAAQLQAQAEAAQAQAEAAAQRALDEAPSARAVHKAVKKAAEETSEQGEALGGWGLEEGQFTKLPPEERLELARQVLQSDKLRRLAELAGRFRNLAVSAQAEKVERTPGQIEGIEIGADLSRVLPTELAYARHPKLRRLFYRRYMERSLMQYRMRGRRKVARGPLVVCYDESASMQGDKEIWAKAVVLALLFVAKRQKRAFAAVAFGSANEIRIKQIPDPRKATMADVLEIAEPFFNGGTDFHRPLTEARQIVEAGGAFERADVVFVTDGIAEVTDDFLSDFLAFKKRTGTRVFGVLVDVGQSAEDSVRRWADQVHRVVDLARDVQAAEEAAKVVFGAI